MQQQQLIQAWDTTMLNSTRNPQNYVQPYFQGANINVYAYLWALSIVQISFKI
jgi:hypothetical protein